MIGTSGSPGMPGGTPTGVKIWFQVVSSHERLPNFLAELQQQCSAIVAPGTIIDVRGTRSGGNGDQFYSVRQAHGAEMLRTAKEEFAVGGYDVYALANSMDPALFELREILDAPVVSFLEAGCFVSNLVGERFGIIVPNAKMASVIGQIVRDYGMGDRLAGILSIEFNSIPDFDKVFADRGLWESMLGELDRKAEKLVAAGADVIMTPGPIACLLARDRITELGSAPVIDMFGALAKIAEAIGALHRCGLTTSRLSRYGMPPDDVLLSALNPADLQFVR